jgi:hypothetical protein
MSRFTDADEPLGRYLPGGKLFRLEEPLVYEIGHEGSGQAIVVPKGFVTDFASIPRLSQVLIPKDIGRRAAIVHDWLYATRGCKGTFTRQQCDEIFLEAMQVLRVPWLVRRAMYRAVRLGGWAAWRKHDPLRFDVP